MHLSHHLYFPEGRDHPTVTVLPTPTTVAPRVTHTAARTTERTTTAPATEARITQKPRGQPRVTQSGGAGETSDRSTTSRVMETTAEQRPGIVASVLWSVWLDYTAPAPSMGTSSLGLSNGEWWFLPVFCFLSVWTGQSRYRVPGGRVLKHWPQQLCQDKRLHVPCSHLLSCHWPRGYTGWSDVPGELSG